MFIILKNIIRNKFYVGMSSDSKPAANVSNGYGLLEIDTGNCFLCDGISWNNTTASGSASWGGITGTLSSQTDLQSGLDAKIVA